MIPSKPTQVIIVNEEEYRAIAVLMEHKSHHEPNIHDYEKILGKGSHRVSAIALCAYHDVPMRIEVAKKP